MKKVVQINGATSSKGNGPLLPAMLSSVSSLFPGLLISIVIALAATFISEHYGGPVMLMALLLGMAFNFLSVNNPCAEGIEFTAKRILKLGVILLGLRITHTDIVVLGSSTFILVCVGVVSTIVFGVLLARVMGLARHFGLLTGGAVAICGASAALAISAVLPSHKKLERDTLFTVIAVTTLSTVAMILYPIITSLSGFDKTAAGIFLGGTIHDVAQVVGAGYTVSEETGNTATLTKMLRVALLVPVVSVIYLLSIKRNTSAMSPVKAAPVFLFGFVALAVLNSLGVIPAIVVSRLVEFSQGCLVTAIAALGMKSSMHQFFSVGRNAIALVVLETVFLATLFAVVVG